MRYLQRVYEGANPLELMDEMFFRIHDWFTEKRLDSDEKELLADMNLKVDWNDQYEREHFVQLTECFSTRSSISEDLSWGEVVGLD